MYMKINRPTSGSISEGFTFNFLYWSPSFYNDQNNLFYYEKPSYKWQFFFTFKYLTSICAERKKLKACFTPWK
jgi:hypothetical protein